MKKALAQAVSPRPPMATNAKKNKIFIIVPRISIAIHLLRNLGSLWLLAKKE